jgi:hypothetical protein
MNTSNTFLDQGRVKSLQTDIDKNEGAGHISILEGLAHTTTEGFGWTFLTLSPI